MWTDVYIDGVDLIFISDVKFNIIGRKRREGGMDKSFIEVEEENSFVGCGVMRNVVGGRKSKIT